MSRLAREVSGSSIFRQHSVIHLVNPAKRITDFLSSNLQSIVVSLTLQTIKRAQ